MDEIAATTPTFRGVSFDLLDKVGSVQWPCNEEHPLGTETMHEGEFARGKGHFVETPYVPTTERSTRKYPLILTTGRILSQYNVGRPDPAHRERRLAPGGPAGDPPARRRGPRHPRR